MPAFLTRQSRECLMQGERRLARRGHMRFVGDPMMRPITKYEFPLCPCIVRSLVRLSLFLNHLLDMFMIRYFPNYHKPYEYYSTGISSEYDSQNRVQQIANEIESWSSDISKDEYAFRLNVLLRSVRHRHSCTWIFFSLALICRHNTHTHFSHCIEEKHMSYNFSNPKVRN